MQEVRDKVLSLLQYHFNSEQLMMIDIALTEATKGFVLTPVETLPTIRIDILPEIGEFLARKKSKGLARGTLVQYKQVLTAFALATPTTIENIKDWDIIKFLDFYADCRGVGNRRKDAMRVILNGFFRYMADSGRLLANPMVTIEPIKYKKKVRQPLTPVEFERFRRGCLTARERAIVEFIFATGCRISEVVALNRTDIDFYTRTIKVTGKGDKERFVYLNAAAIVALEDYFAERKDHQEALFVSTRRPYQRLKNNAIEKIVGRIGERVGINRKVFPHLIRHTMATYMINHGMRIERLQIILGHEKADTTRIYAKDDPEVTKHEYFLAS